MAEPSSVGAGCTVRGTVRGPGPLEVGGTVRGHIDVPGGLTILSGAEVQAEVRTGPALLHGVLRGRLDGSQVDLKASSVLEGSVSTDQITVEEGATVRVEIRMKLDLPPEVG